MLARRERRCKSGGMNPTRKGNNILAVEIFLSLEGIIPPQLLVQSHFHVSLKIINVISRTSIHQLKLNLSFH